MPRQNVGVRRHAAPMPSGNRDHFRVRAQTIQTSARVFGGKIRDGCLRFLGNVFSENMIIDTRQPAIPCLKLLLEAFCPTMAACLTASRSKLTKQPRDPTE